MTARSPFVKRPCVSDSRRPQDIAAEINARNARGRARRRYADPKSPRQIIMRGILAALELGPATSRAINLRMGVKYVGTATSSLCAILERQGLVRRVRMQLRPPEVHHGNQEILWALVEARP